MSHLNLSSQTPLSNLDTAGFATFTNGNIYRSNADDLLRTDVKSSQNMIPLNSSGDYTANLVIRPKIV